MSTKWDANRGIIGLAPPPWDADDEMDWPTEGYDGALYKYQCGPNYENHGIAASGHTREEWVALADEMIVRWTAWREHVQALPE